MKIREISSSTFPIEEEYHNHFRLFLDWLINVEEHWVMLLNVLELLISNVEMISKDCERSSS